MRILIDILHPAHVHFFKYAIKEFKKQGHEVYVTARNIEVAHSLLRFYKIPFISTGNIGKTPIELLKELFIRNRIIGKIIREKKIDILLGISGISIAIMGKLYKKPVIVFSDTEVNGISNKIAFPLASKIITPIYFEKDLGKKHIRYNGFQEYTYLNPKYFKPKPEIPKKYGLTPYNFTICRFSAWKASHDLSHYGISDKMKIKIVNELQKYGDVIISAEGHVPNEITPFLFKAEPHELLDLLAFAKLIVSDTSTVTTEGALLGVPVVRCNSLVGTKWGAAGNMKALESAGLIFNFRDEKQAFEKILELMNLDNLHEIWIKKLRRFLNDKEDSVKVIVDSILQYG